MPCYRRKSPLVKAVRWDGDNFADVDRLLGEKVLLNFDDTLHLATGAFPPIQVGHWLVLDEGDEVVAYDPTSFERNFEAVDDA